MLFRSAGPPSDPKAFFYTRLTDQVKFDYTLFKVAQASDGKYAETAVAASLKEAGADFPCGFMARTDSAVYSIFLRGDGGGSQYGYFTDLVNKDGKPKKYEIKELKRIEQIHGYDKGLILVGVDAAGNSSMKRFTADGEKFEDVVKAGDYVITQVAVTNAGAVSFSGRDRKSTRLNSSH